jgi:glycosyltransferase involved in cell wall biosynthesis
MDVLKYRIGFGDGLRSAAKDLDRRRFDLISTHYPPFDMVASLTHIPHYLHDPGIPSLGTFRYPKDALFWSKVNFSRMVSGRNARCVLPASNYLGSEFRRKYFYRGPMEVLPYGIDFPDYAKREVPFSKYILYVGRHTPYKGVHTLIEIFKEVKEQVPDASLLTIGNADAGYEERLSALASGIGGAHMLGYVPDVWPYYQNASVYATCSSWEGEDRPVIEAQYMGKPAVAFNNCSHPEVVEYGALAADKRSFKEALVKYLSGDYTSSSVSGRIGARFSVETMANRFIGIVRRREGAGE